MNDKRKLTIGIVNRNQYDLLINTIQSIRLYHTDVLDEIEIIVLDKNSNNDTKTELFIDAMMNNQIKGIPVRYVYDNNTRYSAGFLDKQQLLNHCETPYFLYVECGALFSTGGLRKLIDLFNSGEDAKYGIIQGVELNLSLQDYTTHTVFEWSGNQYGIAGKSNLETSEVISVSGARLNVFACRKAVANQIGIFQKSFPSYKGNTDNADNLYCTKMISNANLLIGCLPQLIWTKSRYKNSSVAVNTIPQDIMAYAIAFILLNMDKELNEMIERYSSVADRSKVVSAVSFAKKFCSSLESHASNDIHFSMYKAQS